MALAQETDLSELTSKVQGVLNARGDVRANVHVAIAVPRPMLVDLARSAGIDGCHDPEVLGAGNTGQENGSASQFASKGNHCDIFDVNVSKIVNTNMVTSGLDMLFIHIQEIA